MMHNIYTQLYERGYRGSLNDMVSKWLISKGADVDAPYNQKLDQYYDSIGMPPGVTQERMFWHLRSEGHTGTLNDMLAQWVIPEGGIDPGPEDPVVDPLSDKVVFFWNGIENVTNQVGVLQEGVTIEDNTLFGRKCLDTRDTTKMSSRLFLENLSFELGVDPFTIDYWYKHADTDLVSFPRIVELADNAIYIGQSLRRGYVLWGPTNTGFRTYTELKFDTWTHTAFVYDGTNIHIYEDGKLVGEGPLTFSGGKVTVNNLALGNTLGSSPYYPYRGQLAEFRITSVARWTENFPKPEAPTILATPDA